LPVVPGGAHGYGCFDVLGAEGVVIMAKATFLGLGVMGFPMAGHLAAAGHEVTVYNRTAARMEKWMKIHGGKSDPTPASAAEDRDVVFSCVGNDDDLRAITLESDGAFHAMRKGAVFVDHTTESASIARELGVEEQKRGFRLVMRRFPAASRALKTVGLRSCAAVKKMLMSRWRWLWPAMPYLSGCWGKAGRGSFCKMVNQICLADVLQSLAEGFAFGRQAVLDMDAVLEVLAKGAAGSWQMENRGHTMVEGKFDFGFAVNWMRKDLGICLDEARKMARLCRLPL